MIFLIIIGMAIVTALPRIIPAMLVDKFVFKDWVNRWLQAIPYAALGALIFPGIIRVSSEEPHVGIIGAIVAIILAYIGLNVVIVILGAIATAYVLMNIF